MRRGTVLLVACGVAIVFAAGSTGRPALDGAGKVVETVTAEAGKRCWLVVRGLSETRSTPLTPPVGRTERRCDGEGTWSRDGSMVGFVRRTPRALSVMVVNADGTGLHRVAAIDHRSFGASGIAWSPSGDALLFEVDRRPFTGWNALYGVGVDGSDLRLLALQPDDVGFLDDYGWSPDGTRVAFVRSVGEPRKSYFASRPARLQTIAPDGSGLRTLLVSESIDWAAWSPDGTQLAFERNCFNPVCQLGLVDPTTGAVQTLTHFSSHGRGAGMNPLSSAWRPATPTATIVYARDSILYEVTPVTRTTRLVRRFPCPRRHCDASDVTLAAISSDGRDAVLDHSTLGDSGAAAERYYLVDLETGELTSLPAFHGDVFVP